MADYTRTTIKLPQEVALSLDNNSLGNIKSKYKRHSLITSMFTVLNSFIKKRVTAKSRDLVQPYIMDNTRVRRVTLGKHLVLTKCRITSSDAILPTFPKMALMER